MAMIVTSELLQIIKTDWCLLFTLENLNLQKRMAMIMTRKCIEDFLPKEADDLCWPEEADDLQSGEIYVPHGNVLTFPGPLMSADIKKGELMRFIQGKCQECLLNLDNPDHQKSYYFWSIMEVFCSQKGRVIMPEITQILLKGYGLLRRKLGRVLNQEDWCLPLAQLLCSPGPEEKLRQAVKEMGDKFASVRWTYAAHICYVVAKVELGHCPQFHLIGWDSFPGSKSARREATERTEVYEYVLFLTSGLGQIKFQGLKFLHACELAEAGLNAQALEYCEMIAITVLSQNFPKKAIEWLIWLSEKLLKRKKEREPEWLPMLRMQLEMCVDSYDDSKQSMFMTTSTTTSTPESSDRLQFDRSDHKEFDSLYIMNKKLGSGTFGNVYAGVRKTDRRPVAIKFVVNGYHEKFITIPGDTRSLPLEVALMEMVSRPPRCENVVELLDWFQSDEFLILVMERPIPSMDLCALFELTADGRLPEEVARKVMSQVVRATLHCCDRGVLHRDIKCENILVNPDTLEVKLIDFGCGCLLKDGPYRDVAGTRVYWPPECYLGKEHYGVPAAVWSLGVLLYCLVCGDLPFYNKYEIVRGDLCLLHDLSEECCDLIKQCLEHDAKLRPTLRNILEHKWFSVSEGTSEDDEQYLKIKHHASAPLI